MTEDQIEARDIAMRMLNRREYSRREISQKLSQRGCQNEDIDVVLEMLGNHGYQSDERFAENYTRFRAGKGYGPKRIRLELKEKGVESQLIDQILAQAEIDWAGRVADVFRKKFKGQKAHTWEEKSRQSQFLDYRGFTRKQIELCIDPHD